MDLEGTENLGVKTRNAIRDVSKKGDVDKLYMKRADGGRLLISIQETGSERRNDEHWTI